MKLLRDTVFLLGLSLAFVASARAEDVSTAHYSRAEVQKMMRTAHSAEQYRVLARYFRAQEAHFNQEAQSEKQEWERRNENVTGIAAKYPRPVDSSRNRYQYFVFEANETGQRAAHYEALEAGVK